MEVGGGGVGGGWPVLEIRVRNFMVNFENS